jgi:hypothetical protein
MDTTTRSCGLAFAIVAIAAHPLAAEPRSATPVVLQVYRTSALPADVVDHARRVVSKIYSAADTRVAWRRADMDAWAAEPGVQIAVVIRLRVGEEAPRAVLGFAPDSPAVRGKLAYVFYDHVEAFAVENGLDVGHALGHVIAHEVGHLLLPCNSHSKVGLMRATLTFQELRRAAYGVIPFNSGQAAQIRARVAVNAGP